MLKPFCRASRRVAQLYCAMRSSVAQSDAQFCCARRSTAERCAELRKPTQAWAGPGPEEKKKKRAQLKREAQTLETFGLIQKPKCKPNNNFRNSQAYYLFNSPTIFKSQAQAYYVFKPTKKIYLEAQ
jgi:hypothetical protein